MQLFPTKDTQMCLSNEKVNVPDLVQLDDVRVVQLFHNVHLAVHLLQVRRV